MTAEDSWRAWRQEWRTAGISGTGLAVPTTGAMREAMEATNERWLSSCDLVSNRRGLKNLGFKK